MKSGKTTSESGAAAAATTKSVADIVLHKHMDYSAPGIGNYELLYPFNEETKKFAHDVGEPADDILMQQKIKDIVDHMKSWERTLLQQQRQEQREKMKMKSSAAAVAAAGGGGDKFVGKVAAEDQVAKAMELLR